MSPYECACLQPPETGGRATGPSFTPVSRAFPTGVYKLFLITRLCRDRASTHRRQELRFGFSHTLCPPLRVAVEYGREVGAISVQHYATTQSPQTE